MERGNDPLLQTQPLLLRFHFKGRKRHVRPEVPADRLLHLSLPMQILHSPVRGPGGIQRPDRKIWVPIPIQQRFSNVFTKNAPVVILPHKMVSQSLAQAVGGCMGTHPHNAGHPTVSLSLLKDQINPIPEGHLINLLPGISGQCGQALVQTKTAGCCIITRS